MLKKFIVLILTITILLTGCSAKCVNTPKKNSMQFNNAESMGNKIIEAFDKKDKKLLKSLFNQYVIDNDSDLDNEISKAFDFYEGTSISHSISSGEVSSVENGKKLIVDFPGIEVETNKDKYVIHFIYNIRNDENPNDIGIYRIDIFHRKFVFQYFGDSDGDEYTKLEEEAPVEMMRQTVKNGYYNNEEFKNYKNYLNAGIGVVTCDEETMRKSYFKKNGKEMILYEVDDNCNLIKDENGNKIIKESKTEISS